MKASRVTRFELQLLEEMWKIGPASIREIQERIPEERRPAYTTVQTMIYRLEEKGAVKRGKKIGKAHVFEAVVTRTAVHRRLINDLIDVFGGSVTPLLSHLVDSGKLTLEDVREIERGLAERDKR